MTANFSEGWVAATTQTLRPQRPVESQRRNE
jgi:hypothetical protein